ncbi:hypothetical protein [Sessilibacter corallicola]|uniref:Uncharacterized protein n=1 Tax=Sessilibacter corallicola TaxID=2904075 RepID=A0ABQ0AF32_9GAMM
MPSIVEVKTIGELKSTHTGSLMSRRKKLLKCEESQLKSDRNPDYELELGTIEFKDSKEWKIAYFQLKEELSKREHWTGKR